MRTGQDKLAGLIQLIRPSLSKRKKRRDALGLVNNYRRSGKIQESATIFFGQEAVVRIFKENILELWK